jgi:hypothetical protein
MYRVNIANTARTKQAKNGPLGHLFLLRFVMPLNVESRMVLARVKIEWAKRHLRSLAAEILALEHIHVVIRKDDSEVPPHPITFLHDGFPKVPVLSFDAVCLAGDIVHNLRAALDHLAQQLALIGCPTLSQKELRGIEFPIAETLAKYESDKARKVKGMRPEAIEAIDNLRPYKGGNDSLWQLHALDNIDKHRSLFTFGTDFVFTSDWFDGTYLFRTDNPHFAGVEPDVEKDIKLDIENAISNPEIGQTNALLPSLHQLVDYVENLVLSFRPLLK